MSERHPNEFFGVEPHPRARPAEVEIADLVNTVVSLRSQLAEKDKRIAELEELVVELAELVEAMSE